MVLFKGQFRRIYHYHLKKCGGTYFNSWLRQHTSDGRDNAGEGMVYNGKPQSDWTYSRENPIGADVEAAARGLFYWADVIYTHAAWRDYATDDTFCITIIRNPVDRIISQVADWRREMALRRVDLHPPIYNFMSDVDTLSLRSFLEKHAFDEARPFFDNYLIRALATTNVDPYYWESVDYPDMTSTALRTMWNRYHLVGLAENMQATQAALAAALGLVPERVEGTRLNVTNSKSALQEEAEDAADILAELTAYDAIVYEQAARRFDEHHSVHADYDERAFESGDAHDAVKRLTPMHRAGYTVFSVRDALIVSGIHGRDGAGYANCRVWTGPSTRTVIYFPVPVGERLEVRLWVHGYASQAILRHTLRMEIDDIAVPHQFVPEAGWHEVVVMQAVSRRPFMKLTIHLDETLDSIAAGQGPGDPRRRGLSFDSYGWRVVQSYPVAYPAQRSQSLPSASDDGEARSSVGEDGPVDEPGVIDEIDPAEGIGDVDPPAPCEDVPEDTAPGTDAPAAHQSAAD